jgi:hypothetical protein
MKYILIAAALASSCYGDKGYNKSLDKCAKKCYPHVVRSVEYNFSNNKYDKCVCNLDTRVEEINEGE